ncbi:MAG: phosphoglucosamine mutase [Deltaproteobacteria bacterium HGW-Deltaproteobacteria-13]|jgi:phosphoglucosamine mutase|nr:MAG: phosphoglucosamine mutase [Deltaproteobacteria bacterium HGW-Deltaproteobacteria-13]
MGKLFGTDGIRGIANQYPMTTEVAVNVGRAIACLSKKKGHTPRILIGRDTRLSGDMFEAAIISGICSMGVNAISVGVIPTPGIAFLTQDMRADAGIVISASHNPSQDNGIKIFNGDGFKLSDEKENKIEELLFADNLHKLNPTPKEFGKLSRLDDATGRYVDFLKATFPKNLNPEGMKIVLDCSNGATYRVAPEVFAELGCEVITLFDQPDGKNINLNCGSQHTEALAAEVLRQKADAGFAFDGDGDRVIAVDDKGNILTGDRMLAICSVILKKEDRLKNNFVVRTVMSNLGLTVAFQKLKIDSVFAPVGDRFVLEEMLARGAVIGGEDSGHLIFLDHHTTGDGLITALQVLAAIKKENKPLSELARVMDVFPQMLINIDVKRKPEIETIPEIMAAIKKAEEALGDKGRVLVRYSGTQNMCRVMVEGPTKKETETHCRKIADVVRKILA